MRGRNPIPSAIASASAEFLNGYDKGADPSGKRQEREIRLARRRLEEFGQRQARERAIPRARSCACRAKDVADEHWVHNLSAKDVEALDVAMASGATEHAELVALWVGQHNPRPFALSGVNPRRTEPDQPLDLRVTVVGTEVEMQSVLDRLRFRNANEQQAWKPIRRRPNLELLRIVIDDDPSQCVLPPPPECTGVVGVDGRLLPVERHDWRVCPPSNPGWKPRQTARQRHVAPPVDRGFDAWKEARTVADRDRPRRVPINTSSCRGRTKDGDGWPFLSVGQLVSSPVDTWSAPAPLDIAVVRRLRRASPQ